MSQWDNNSISTRGKGIFDSVPVVINILHRADQNVRRPISKLVSHWRKIAGSCKWTVLILQNQKRPEGGGPIRKRSRVTIKLWYARGWYQRLLCFVHSEVKSKSIAHRGLINFIMHAPCRLLPADRGYPSLQKLFHSKSLTVRSKHVL